MQKGSLHSPHNSSLFALSHLHLLPQTSVAEVLAAMVPCSRLYAFLGCSLARAAPSLAAPAPSANPYADWVAMYSGFEYGVLPMQKEQLLDRLAAGGGDGARYGERVVEAQGGAGGGGKEASLAEAAAVIDGDQRRAGGEKS